MFEHFRTMFLITFQMNATVLYLVPLSLKLRKEPILLATILIGLMSIFRAYPCVGDVAFYLALLPLWKRSWKCKLFCFIYLIAMFINLIFLQLWYTISLYFVSLWYHCACYQLYGICGFIQGLLMLISILVQP